MRVAVAVLAGYGALLAATATCFGWGGLGPGPSTAWLRLSPRGRVGGVPENPTASGGHRSLAAGHLRRRLDEAGLARIELPNVAGALATFAGLGAIAGWAMLASPVGAACGSAAATALVIGLAQRRRRARRELAMSAWPRLIDEIRVLAVCSGRSIPQALFEVGARGPSELRPAFDAARREWLVSTDLGSAMALLRTQLADPTADVACETLLVAHELGGTDADQRLSDLADDRRTDLRHRREARARQVGARFARSFVLLVPAGMALAGMSVGSGREAFRSPGAQVAVLACLTIVAGCWWWASRIMQLPWSERVTR